MKKQLNIKALAKGMRVEDKAKLLFADRNKRAETSGHEGFLTPDEEKALIKDAQDLHQISELNRLNRLFNIASLLLLDIQTAYLHFVIAIGKVDMILTGITLTGSLRDATDHMIYDLAVQGYTSKQLKEKGVTKSGSKGQRGDKSRLKMEEEKFQKEIDQKARELRKKYGVGDKLVNVYDHFSPSLRAESYFSEKTKTESEPNQPLQKFFMLAVKRVKDFRKQVYQGDYVVELARMELLSEKEKESLKGFNEEIDKFVSLKGIYRQVKLYEALADRGMIRTTKLSEPRFLKTVKNMKKATQLTEGEKEKAEVEIDELLEKQSFS